MGSHERSLQPSHLPTQAASPSLPPLLSLTQSPSLPCGNVGEGHWAQAAAWGPCGWEGHWEGQGIQAPPSLSLRPPLEGGEFVF